MNARICHRLVTGLGGAIEIDSAPGRCTAARVILPPAERAAGAPIPAAPIPATESPQLLRAPS